MVTNLQSYYYLLLWIYKTNSVADIFCERNSICNSGNLIDTSCVKNWSVQFWADENHSVAPQGETEVLFRPAAPHTGSHCDAGTAHCGGNMKCILPVPSAQKLHTSFISRATFREVNIRQRVCVELSCSRSKVVNGDNSVVTSISDSYRLFGGLDAYMEYIFSLY